MKTRDNWRASHSLALLLIPAALILLNLYSSDQGPLAYLVTIILLALFAGVTGHGIMGDWRGALIDERNKISLSRLQLLAWTILVLSGVSVAVIGNLALGAADPAAIAIPEELWVLLGISTTSLIGSPLIRTTKTTKQAEPGRGPIRPPDPASRREMTEALTFEQLSKQGVDVKNIDTDGLIIENRRADQARWSDLFRGEETANAAQLELGKIQMFYFTVILLVVYGITLGSDLSRGEIITGFPKLSEGMVALLGISHVGYLAHKAVPHTTTT